MLANFFSSCRITSLKKGSDDLLMARTPEKVNIMFLVPPRDKGGPPVPAVTLRAKREKNQGR